MKVSAHTALLVIDMINPFDFDDGAAHAKAALSIAPAIGRLKARVRDAGGQCIYVNDNFGRWKSNFLQIIERAERAHARVRRPRAFRLRGGAVTAASRRRFR